MTLRPELNSNIDVILRFLQVFITACKTEPPDGERYRVGLDPKCIPAAMPIYLQSILI
jgi:hypothetical protein